MFTYLFFALWIRSVQGLVRSAEQNLSREGGRRYVYDGTDEPRDIIEAVRKSSYSRAVPSNVDEIVSYYYEDETSDFDAPEESTRQRQELREFT